MSYYIEIDECWECESYEQNDCGRGGKCYHSRQTSEKQLPKDGVPDWCPRNAKPAEYVRKLEKQQAEQKNYDELKRLYLDALEEVETLEEEYRQVLAKLPKGD